MSVEAYPLQWPAHWPRTEERQRAQFKVSFAQARDGLLRELQMMGATDIVISSNTELRLDGLPYSGRAEPSDTGVSVYFTIDEDQKAIPCDKWSRTRDNMRAIELTIGALRGLERWGAKHMVDAAFQGFAALPDQSQTGWWDVFEVDRWASDADVTRSYRVLLMTNHPDKGGDPESFHTIQAAYEEFKRERGLR